MAVKSEKKADAPVKEAEKQENVEAQEQMADNAIEAKFLVRRYMLYTGGAGLIPIPFVDALSVGALQLKMIKELGDMYGHPFKEHIVRGAISALVGGVAAVSLVRSTGGLLKSVPLVGSILGGASMGIYSSAATYAIGRVFIRHFESGGTYLTFNPSKYRQYYREQFHNAKKSEGEQPAVA